MESESISEEFSPELLREWRKNADLSIKQLAFLSHVSIRSISNGENGKQRLSLRTWDKLKKILRIEYKKAQERQADTWITPPKTPLLKLKTFDFIIGNIYTIRDIRCGGHAYSDIYPHFGALCNFRYERKDGIHHVFTETQGDWTRTYTDAQLIGKRIEEVGHERS